MRRNRTDAAITNARSLRRKMSEAEKRLWNLLRRKSLGFRFRRQYAIANYYLDFYCPEARVCVEVDGDLHDNMRDARRDHRLAALGILTVRIPTGDLYPSAQPAADLVWKVCSERSRRPPP